MYNIWALIHILFPNTGNETGVGGVCPVGHYCPTGTTVPLPCAAGAFSNVTGLSTCHQCPAGYYCLLGADNYVGTPCDPGYYCPAGTTSATQYPCPAGTFYNLTMATSVSDCLPCPGGEFCATPGLSAPTGKCSPGKNEFVKWKLMHPKQII